MIPSRFEYVAAGSAAEAVDLLRQHGDDAKLLAGGHSLLPMMKVRLAAPSVLVDIGAIPALSYVRVEDGQLAIGAATTHQAVATSPVVRAQAPLLAWSAGLVGDPQQPLEGEHVLRRQPARAVHDDPGDGRAVPRRRDVHGPWVVCVLDRPAVPGACALISQRRITAAPPRRREELRTAGQRPRSDGPHAGVDRVQPRLCHPARHLLAVDAELRQVGAAQQRFPVGGVGGEARHTHARADVVHQPGDGVRLGHRGDDAPGESVRRFAS